MSILRLLFVLSVGLVPLALLRELWWSELLFLRPWEALGGGQLALGVFADLLSGWFAGLLTLIMGLFIALALDVVLGFSRRASSALLLALALAACLITIALIPTLSFAASWILGGYLLAALLWLQAVLQIGRPVA